MTTLKKLTLYEWMLTLPGDELKKHLKYSDEDTQKFIDMLGLFKINAFDILPFEIQGNFIKRYVDTFLQEQLIDPGIPSRAIAFAEWLRTNGIIPFSDHDWCYDDNATTSISPNDAYSLYLQTTNPLNH